MWELWKECSNWNSFFNQQKSSRLVHDNSLYKTPESELNPQNFLEGQEFYVVSIAKFSSLFLATMGLYSIYWFYTNWKLQKRHHGLSAWPIPRALFSEFFVYSFFSRVDQSLHGKKLSHHWSPTLLATLYVLNAILNYFLEWFGYREIGSPFTDVFSLLLIFFTYWILKSAQHAINISQGDLQGESNSQLTPLNFLWIMIGILMWLLVIFSFLIIFDVGPESWLSSFYY